MIPADLVPTVLRIGPLAVPVFGVLVMTGVVVGHALVLKLAGERGIDLEEMRGAALWALVAGFAGAHLVDVLVYRPDKLERDGLLALVKVWDGISSYGGFLGALLGTSLYFRKIGKSWWPQADVLLQGLVAGWAFGRLGCTLTGDHLGRLTTFPLAFAYTGGARHNLGFYEFAYTVLVMIPAMLAMRRREKRAPFAHGTWTAAIVLLYAPARFAMDFLRATDIAHPDRRWAGLTAAQYASLLAVPLALLLLRTLATRAGRGDGGRGPSLPG